ncbi:MAG: discoidin domain-containing protein [Sedimentisphaerales bacterium]|nr:discoidin domain-containing protein [Sedimentisphaerales bacterium]
MCRKLIFSLSIIFVLIISNYAPAELVAHWKLDDGSGTIAKDSAGDFDGALENGPLWIQGVIGGALWFDGTDDCVLIGSDPAFNPTGSFSVGLWANIEDWTVEWGCSPIGIRGDGVGWCLRRFGSWWSTQYPDTYTMPTNVLSFTTRGIGHVSDDVEDSPSTSVPPLNEWIHITCIYDNEGNKKLIYFDGEVDAEWDTNIETLTSATQNLYIGAISNMANTGPEQFFSGKLDDVRFYNHALSYEEIQSAMAGIAPGVASTPYPVDETTDVPRDVTFSWTPGQFVDKHNVYLGNSFDDVNSADASSSLLIGPGVDVNSFEPGRLVFSQEYFWRVDEVNAPPDNTVFKGDVWSFTVEPLAYSIPPINIKATASSYYEDEISYNPRNTINNSGMTGDLHSKNVDYMWLTDPDATLPVWIQYEFDKVYKLQDMLVWNYNGPSALRLSGLKDVTVEYSTDGTGWTQIPDVTEFTVATGKDNYAANTIVPFNGLAAKYVRITATSNWSNGVFTDYGLSEVRFSYIPVSAREPSPIDEATNVPVNVTIGWRAGREASEHNVYIGTDEQAVMDGTVSATTISRNSYGPLSLDLSSTYYWRVDEVNGTDIWPSKVWSFTIEDYLVVDDFEGYNDIPEGEEGSNLVYLTWTDGYDNPSVNGSVMGYVSGGSLETTLVHGSGRSVPVEYNNSQASLSEVTVNPADLAIGSDWTAGSPETLVLWFLGDPDNATTEQMYVKINGVKVEYAHMDNIGIRRWNQWNIDLASLGISLANVTTFTIGFERTGATGGTGTVLFDDIRLYRLAPPIPEPVDPGNAGLVAHYPFDADAADATGNGYNGTFLDDAVVQGGVLVLDGIDDAVSIPRIGGQDAVFGQVTYSMFVYPTIDQTSLTYSGGINTNNWVAGAIHFKIVNGVVNVGINGAGSDLQGTTVIPPNTWSHMALTVSESAITLYLNGVAEVTRELDAPLANLILGNAAIGAFNENGTNVQREFTGQIDEVRIYDRALTEGELLFLADQLL